MLSRCSPTKRRNVSCMLMHTGWKTAVDKVGRTYYFNKQLKQSQYENPNLMESPPLPPPIISHTTTETKRYGRCDPLVSSPSPGPSSSTFSSTKRKAEEFHFELLSRQRICLLAKIPLLERSERIDAVAELAGIENDLMCYRC